MSNFDKYEPRVGGFRAKLNADIASTDVGKIFAVTLNGSGRVVRTGLATDGADVVGVIVAVRPMLAAEPIDVMTGGEITDATETAGTAFTAGAKVYAHADGTVNDTATAGTAIGRTVEVDRLVVRVGQFA